MFGCKRIFLYLVISFSLVNCSIPLKCLKFSFVCVCCTDLLAEHLQEIRALRQRLEESIRTNDRLREQLEKRLAEVEKDPGTYCPILSHICNISAFPHLLPSVYLLGNSAHKIKFSPYNSAATNIFIHGNEEQGQLANEVRFLWGQNQALKEQFNLGSRGKHTLSYKLI